ncbi:MAG TPA: TraB/GumN family protein [Trueperaceae bacterium]|nr:TraB/GumN family protein [Trueperaceae bacterium]
MTLDPDGAAFAGETDDGAHDDDREGGTSASDVATLIGEQPHAEVEAHGVRFTLLGTAHVSKTSAETVTRLAASGRFDAIAIELDPGRHAALTDEAAWAKMDLFRVFRERKAGMVAANLALGAFQQRLADQLGIEPGAEMKAAIRAADEAGLPLLLVDRDIGVTLRRVYANVPWWQRVTILAGLAASVLSREQISEEEIERLKEGDMLEATFTEFAERSERMYQPLIAERDRFMAARLEQEAAGTGPQGPREVLVVLGAGHLQGVAATLREPPGEPAWQRIAALSEVPKGRPWGRIVAWTIVAIVLIGFAIGFARSPALGLSLLVDWVVINGGLAALGAIIALAHPLTVVVTALAAPLTSLNPLIGAGFVAAGVEMWLRKPNIGDFATLRQDVTSLRGWWRNRVARVFLVFIFATLGSAIGTYLAGFRIFGRLLG